MILPAVRPLDLVRSASALVGLGLCVAAHGQASRPPEAVYRMQAASADVRWGSVVLEPGGRGVLADLQGAGVITRFWGTFGPSGDPALDQALARALVVTISWEGAATPAVSAPLADFFCQPLQLQAVDNEFFSSSNGLCVFDCRIPMPFRRSARVEIVNDSNRKLNYFYLVHVDRRAVEEDALYLHAHWRRTLDVAKTDSVVVLPSVAGRGRYLGTHWAIHQERPGRKWVWYDRRCLMYADQDSRDPQARPTLKINSIDDYMFSGWWSQEQEHPPYFRRHAGRSYVREEGERLSTVLYRYHVDDPIWFQKSFSFDLFSLPYDVGASDWSSTAFFYLDRPENGLPAIQDVRRRMLGFEKGAAITEPPAAGAAR